MFRQVENRSFLTKFATRFYYNQRTTNNSTHDSHGNRHLGHAGCSRGHLGMGASSPKMRIEKRKSAAASVSLCMVLK